MFLLNKSSELLLIADEIKNCTKCNLCKNRINSIPGDGNVNADIILIGEAGGKTENQTGKPFVGKAGKLLDECLSIAGIERQNIFVTNICKCAPPDNRQPTNEEIIACLPYLYNQISTIQPKLIVAAGATAIWSLTAYRENLIAPKSLNHLIWPGSPNVSMVINELTYLFNKITRRFENVLIYPIWHPAYILRNPQKKLEYIGSIMKINFFLEKIKDNTISNTHMNYKNLFDEQIKKGINTWPSRKI